MAFNQDGSRVITAALDGTARLWSGEGAALGELQHRGRVLSASFNHDGSRLLTATASAEGTTRIWRAFATTQALIDHANAVLPRQLTAEQRRRYFLD